MRPVIGVAAGFTTVSEFWLWRFVGSVLCVVVAERIQRPFASVTAGTLKRFDSGNEMVRDEHQLEIEGSRHVLNGREARINGGALKVRDLSLAYAQLARELSLTQLAAQACLSEDVC